MPELDAVAEAKRLPTQAEVLAAHRWGRNVGWIYKDECHCGWKRADDPGPGTALECHRRHQVDMLREAATVHTVEELDALPDGSIVRDAGGAAWSKDGGYRADIAWWLAGNECEQPASSVDLPALVLWSPAEPVADV